MRASVVCLALWLGLCQPAGAAEPAAIDSPQVRAGMAAHDALEYERAVQLLEDALKESLTREEKIVALRVIAFSCFALGREPQTRAALERLLRVDPSHQLDRRVTPKLRSLLEETRTARATRPAPPVAASALPPMRVTVDPARPSEGKPLSLRVEARSADAPLMSLFHRSGRQRAFARVEARRGPGGRYEVTLPGAALEAPTFEYYALLVDGGGTPVAGAGSFGDPLYLPVTRPPRPVYKRAWFWGTLGGIAAAGVLATALALTLPPPPPAQVTLEPH